MRGELFLKNYIMKVRQIFVCDYICFVVITGKCTIETDIILFILLPATSMLMTQF